MRAPHRREIVHVEGPDGRGARCLLVANERWLPIESGAGALRSYRTAGFRLGQVMCLESDGSPRLVLKLFEKLYERFTFHGLDVVFAVVDPGDCELYGRFLFQRAGWPRFSWNWADYAEVEVVWLDVRAVDERATKSLRARFLRSAD